MPPSKLADKILSQVPKKTGETPVQESDAVLDVNQAALALFSVCPPPLNAVCAELCQTLQIQPWMLIVGHLLKADDRAELHAPLLPQDWTEGTPTPQVLGKKRCKTCNLALERDPNADFCCNFCGSGRFVREHVHHPNCEHFIVPKRYIQSVVKPLQTVAPEDPEERAAFEAAAFDQHLQEHLAAEAQPSGLPPVPGVLTDPRAEWAGVGKT